MKNQVRTIFIISVVFFLVIAFMWRVLTWAVIGEDFTPVNVNALNLTEEGTAESSTASILFFHNETYTNKPNGIEIITHGERLVSFGNLYFEGNKQETNSATLKNRISIDSLNQLRAELFFEQLELTFELHISLFKNSFRMSIFTERPIPRTMSGKLQFQIGFYPPAYRDKYFTLDGIPGFISGTPERMTLITNESEESIIEGSHLILAAEEPSRRISINQQKGKLKISKEQQYAPGQWFSVGSELPTGQTGEILTWEVSIHQVKNWQREPVLLFSQIGYHPDQPKKILLELPGYDRYVEDCELLKLDTEGKWKRIRFIKPVYQDQYLRYHYYEFDISNVRETGIYVLEYKDKRSKPFLISERALSNIVWQPTLETFFPSVMDHVEANNFNVIYRLGLSWILFQPEIDNSTFDREHGWIRSHFPDGKPDLLQQMEHGAEFLLGYFQASSHSTDGTIVPEIKRSHLFGISKALAVSSICLQKFNPVLSKDCYETSVNIWESTINKAPENISKNKGGKISMEAEKINATAELYLLTGEQIYRDVMNDLLPEIEDNFFETTVSVSRIYDGMNDRFRELYMTMAGNILIRKIEEINKNPFRIPLKLGKKGISGDILEFAVNLYMLHRIFPEMIDPEYVHHAIQYVWGVHPGSSISLVSGIGNHSMKEVYGIRPLEHSYISGGVVPGPVLIRPDFHELKEDWPYLPQQSTYQMEDAAIYIFAVLAASELLN